MQILKNTRETQSVAKIQRNQSQLRKIDDAKQSYETEIKLNNLTFQSLRKSASQSNFQKFLKFSKLNQSSQKQKSQINNLSGQNIRQNTETDIPPLSSSHINFGTYPNSITKTSVMEPQSSSKQLYSSIFQRTNTVKNTPNKNYVFTNQFFFKQKNEQIVQKPKISINFFQQCKEFFHKNNTQQFKRNLQQIQLAHSLVQKQPFYVADIHNNPESNISKEKQIQFKLHHKRKIKNCIQNNDPGRDFHKIYQQSKENKEMQKIEQLQNQGLNQYSFRIFLVIKQEYFEMCTSKNSLIYCYYQIPFSGYYERENYIQDQFKNILVEINEKLKINAHKVYVYLKDGTNINHHYEIPQDQVTLIVSSWPCFIGIYDVSIKKNPRFLKLIEDLEKPLIYDLQKNSHQNLPQKQTFEKQVMNRYQPIINSIIQSLNIQKIVKIEDDGLNEKIELIDQHDYNNEFNVDSKAWETLYHQLNKKQKTDIYEFLKNQKQGKLEKNFKNYSDNLEYIEDSETLISLKKKEEIQNIINYYQDEIQSIQFHEIEQNSYNNEILTRIMNKLKPKVLTQEDLQEYKKNPIRKEAESIGIFKPPIRQNKEFEFLKYPKEEIRAQPLQISEETKDEKKQKKQIIDKKKFMMTKIIASYMSKLLHEMEQKKESTISKIKKFQLSILELSNEEDQVNQASDDDSVIQEKSEKSNQSLQIDFDDEEEQNQNYMKKNIKDVLTKKKIQIQINKANSELYKKNINQIILDIPKIATGIPTNKLSTLTRFDIHNIYTIYKTLHVVTSQRYSTMKNNYDIEDGLDYDVYRQGLYQIFMQSEGLAQMIFNKIDYNNSGFMDWQEFLKLMVIIRAKTLAQKINLFIKIADQNRDGQLDWREIKELTQICLEKYLPTKNDQDKEFLDSLSDYFTKLIFNTVDVEYKHVEGQDNPDGEIPFSEIKKTIIEGHKADSDLLCMFCGADI